MSAVRRFGSGGPWEDAVGYSRAVAAGPWVLSAGCTSTVDGEVIHVGDAAAQAREAFRADADPVGAVHAELFGMVRPVTAMIVAAGFMHPDHLVEVEVEAFVP